MNKILDQIIKDRKGHYCHCLEVSDKYALESVVEGVIEGYQGYTEEQYIDFFETMTIYYLPEDGIEVKEHEEEVYAFSFREYIEGTI